VIGHPHPERPVRLAADTTAVHQTAEPPGKRWKTAPSPD
jgi:hypothetical protein